MAASGWYPDPGGEPGRYRFWDGSAWTALTTQSPTQQSQPTAAAPTRRREMILFAVAVVAGLAVIVALIVIPVQRRPAGSPVAPDTSPTSEYSRAPVPPPAADPSGAPSTRPGRSPAPTASPRLADPGWCVDGDQESRAPSSADGRIRGGDLSFRAPEGVLWHINGVDPGGWSWTADVATVHEDGSATGRLFDAVTLRVGRLPIVGDESVRQAAHRFTSCLLTRRQAAGMSILGVRELESRAVTVDGHRAWLLRTEVAHDTLLEEVQGTLVHLLVVESRGRQSFFVGEAPYPDERRLSWLQAAAADLTVD